MKNSTTLKGKSSEYFFCYEALKRGYKIAQPLQEDNKYDFLLDLGDRIVKIQIKSATKTSYVSYGKSYERYNFKLISHDGKKYSCKDVDFVVVFIEDLKTFYMLPPEIFTKRKAISIHNNKIKTTKWNQYRDDWSLLEKRK